MIDIIEETIAVLTKDAALMELLGGNEQAVCYLLSPGVSIMPRIALELTDDADDGIYDGRAAAYSAGIRFLIVGDEGHSKLLFKIASRLNDLLKEYGFRRTGHSDRFDFNLGLFLKEMYFTCKIMTEGNEFAWLK